MSIGHATEWNSMEGQRAFPPVGSILHLLHYKLSHCVTLIDWIAYGLMDSIVDTFFPLIDFIESESNAVDAFLADPLQSTQSVTGKKGKKVDNIKSVSETARLKPSVLLRLRVPTWFEDRLPLRLRKQLRLERELVRSHTEQFEMFARQAKVIKPRTISKKALKHVDDRLFDRAGMLKRIADTRKLITALSRLLHSKTEVVRGLRKRVQQEHVVTGGGEPGMRHDINIYLGDLQGEACFNPGLAHRAGANDIYRL